MKNFFKQKILSELGSVFEKKTLGQYLITVLWAGNVELCCASFQSLQNSPKSADFAAHTKHTWTLDDFDYLLQLACKHGGRLTCQILADHWQRPEISLKAARVKWGEIKHVLNGQDYQFSSSLIRHYSPSHIITIDNTDDTIADCYLINQSGCCDESCDKFGNPHFLGKELFNDFSEFSNLYVQDSNVQDSKLKRLLLAELQKKLQELYLERCKKYNQLLKKGTDKSVHGR
ncbi:MAG: hypothetical protein LBB11_02375 [Puniceicoccales bacterium]|jgi:hypothetical protein|nr:hypothetical protein [Puniceicoccales bacterium]